MKKIVALTLTCLTLSVAGCSDTIYGVPKSEWYTLTPREQQQLAATNSLGAGGKPAFFKIFEKPQLTPEQQSQQAVVNANNQMSTNSVKGNN